MNLSCDSRFVKRLGADAAIVLQNCVWWYTHAAKNKTCEHDGRHWFRMAATAWLDTYDCFTPAQMRNILKKLKDSGILISDQLSPNKSDRTLYYTIVDPEVIAFYELDIPVREPSEDVDWDNDNTPVVERPSKVDIKHALLESVTTVWLRYPHLIQPRSSSGSQMEALATRLNSLSKEGHTSEAFGRAIELYANVLSDSNSFFKHRWTITEFFKRANGYIVFAEKTHADFVSTPLGGGKIATPQHTQQVQASQVDASEWEVEELHMSPEEYGDYISKFADWMDSGGANRILAPYYEKGIFVNDKTFHFIKKCYEMRLHPAGVRYDNVMKALVLFLNRNYTRDCPSYMATMPPVDEISRRVANVAGWKC